MKIVSMKIKNFRSYKDEVKIDFADLTALVGKNDIGKSTILEALDIFFNDNRGVVALGKDDISVYAEDNEVVITVCFSVDPNAPIIIDSEVDTTLADEYMLNNDGLLEIIKKYKNADKASVFIRACHPTCPDCSDLLLKKNAELKKIISTKGITCENQNINKLMRSAIWQHYAERLDLREIEIDASKEDAKRIWEKLSPYLPLYSLFQADRKNNDSDSEVQDPLKFAVKQIINDEGLQEQFASIADIVVEKLREVSERTMEKLREINPEIAASLHPVIPTSDKLKWADVFKSVSISGDENIPINKRGSGVKRIILFSFFKAEVDRRRKEGNNNGAIYAIEEPETSQHPNSQRELVNSLKELAAAPDTQVIITTHSPIIVKELDFKEINIIYEDEIEKKKRILHAAPAALKYPSLNEVNYTAYGEMSEEYHNELYSFLIYQKWLGDYQSGKLKRKYNYVDKYGNISKTEDKVLAEYIRHQIHHPENKKNEHFTKDELKQSIEEMREYIKLRIEEEGL